MLFKEKCEVFMVLFLKKLYNNTMAKLERSITKKATLLIQHLEAIYTMMPPSFPIVHHGFLAVHHEEILAIGEGEGWAYVDKDTRILEGRGHLLIPGMIDVSITLPGSIKQAGSFGDAQRSIKAACEIWMKHGTLAGNLQAPIHEAEEMLLQQFQAPFEFDFLRRPYLKHYGILSPFTKNKRPSTKHFCISCAVDEANCLDQLLCAKLSYQGLAMDAQSILAACTLYPAQMLGLPRLGSLARGKLANILMLEGQCIEDVFTRFHGDEHMQVIKEGTRRYPNIII